MPVADSETLDDPEGVPDGVGEGEREMVDDGVGVMDAVGVPVAGAVRLPVPLGDPVGVLDPEGDTLGVLDADAAGERVPVGVGV